MQWIRLSLIAVSVFLGMVQSPVMGLDAFKNFAQDALNTGATAAGHFAGGAARGFMGGPPAYGAPGHGMPGPGMGMPPPGGMPHPMMGGGMADASQGLHIKQQIVSALRSGNRAAALSTCQLQCNQMACGSNPCTYLICERYCNVVDPHSVTNCVAIGRQRFPGAQLR